MHIDLGDIGPVMGNGLDEQVVQPGSAMQFLAALTLATRDDTVTVTWASTPGGERRTWKRPLPPKPRKGGAVWGA